LAWDGAVCGVLGCAWIYAAKPHQEHQRRASVLRGLLKHAALVAYLALGEQEAVVRHPTQRRLVARDLHALDLGIQGKGPASAGADVAHEIHGLRVFHAGDAVGHGARVGGQMEAKGADLLAARRAYHARGLWYARQHHARQIAALMKGLLGGVALALLLPS
jgi:hypothetical protein